MDSDSIEWARWASRSSAWVGEHRRHREELCSGQQGVSHSSLFSGLYPIHHGRYTREFPRHETSLMLRRSNQADRPITQRDAVRLKALHFGEIQHLDRMLGRFFARLEASGLPERTLVVLTSDHGDQFGELGAMGHGSSLHDAVLHVPFLRHTSHCSGVS